MRIASLALLLLAFSVFGVSACESERTIETDEGTVTVDGAQETMIFSGKGEEKFEMKTGEGVELPENFPQDVPLYPDATIVASMASQEGVMVSCQSPADPAEVVVFYKEKLSGQGWTVEAEMNMGPQRMISFAKADRHVTVTATSDAGKTQISLLAGR